MESVQDLARQLGSAIAESPQGQAVTHARQSLLADADAKKLLMDYQMQAEKIAALEEQNKPVEVDDKHRLEALQQQVAGDAHIKRLTEAEMDLVALVRQVHEIIAEQLAPLGPPEE